MIEEADAWRKILPGEVGEGFAQESQSLGEAFQELAAQLEKRPRHTLRWEDVELLGDRFVRFQVDRFLAFRDAYLSEN